MRSSFDWGRWLMMPIVVWSCLAGAAMAQEDDWLRYQRRANQACDAEIKRSQAIYADKTRSWPEMEAALDASRACTSAWKKQNPWNDSWAEGDEAGEANVGAKSSDAASPAKLSDLNSSAPVAKTAGSYPRAAEIKRACASIIEEYYSAVQKRYGGDLLPKAEQNEIIDGWIEAYSQMSVAEAREEWKFSGATTTKCIIDQLEAHQGESKTSALAGDDASAPSNNSASNWLPSSPANSVADAGSGGGSSDQRYWLKGKIEIADCAHDCPAVALAFTVETNDAYGSRQTGAQYPSDFGFGPPMAAGTTWRIENPILSEFYKCEADPVEGKVAPEARAINVAFAVPSTVITCELNERGKARIARESATKSEADARFEAEQLKYEQMLAAQRQAVADYEAQQRQAATDRAAAAARAGAAQEEFARQQAAYQAEQDRYARERAEYEAKLTGQPVAAQGAGASPPPSTKDPGGSSAPPLSPNAAFEAHNPANEASGCLDLIYKRDFEARGVTSIMGAAFRNTCPFPVTIRWCFGERCATGYDNTGTALKEDPATVQKEGDLGVSYDQPAPGTTTENRWAACRLGFAYRPDLASSLQYACK